MPPVFGSVKTRSRGSEGVNVDQKAVPAELTLNGTTPSGKPRLYVCNICTRAFARQEHLKRHERSHTKEKPFACTICSRKFSRRDLLLRHSTKLHAGAAEVVPRLRRRSTKASSPKESSDHSEGDSPVDVPSTRVGTRRSKRRSVAGFESGSSVNKPTSSALRKHSSGPSPALETKLRADSEVRDEFTVPTLKTFDYKLEFPVNRRASFSALSGSNYAMPTPEPYAAEAVEFSTPQLLPFDDDAEQWLNSLPNLDLMDHQNGIAPFQQSTETVPSTTDVRMSSHASGEDLAGYSFYDLPYKQVGSLFAHNNYQNRDPNQPGIEEQLMSGVSASNKQAVHPFKAHVSPLMQESPDTDSSLVTQPANEKVDQWQETLFNQNINDLEAIADLNVSKTFDVPQGYSFYGNSDQNTISHSSVSSNATISPVLLDNTLFANSRQASPKQGLNSDYYEKVSRSSSNQSTDHKSEFVFSKSKFEKCSRVNLFTSNIRNYIHHSLSKYPFFGVPSPTLPENEKLNFFASEFKNKFLNHHPFIHHSMLNEYSLMKSTLSSLEEDIVWDENSSDNTRVSLVCLPLLIATIGAIVSNKKSDAANLYEASRRCIHVYLETRKKLIRQDGDNRKQVNNSSPLWLIQSLTLSVIYGLFADDEISLNVIIRQVSALCSLVKSSGLNCIKADLPNDVEINEAYLERYIQHESTVRTVHTIFHISSLLSTLYNIAPSMKIDDLKIDLPASTFLWECTNPSEFRNLIESFDYNPKDFHLVLKELVILPFQQLDPRTGAFGKSNFFSDNHVSEYGLVCLQNGLHQLAYLKNLLATMPEVGNVSNFMSLLGSDEQNLAKVGENWSTMLRSCGLYHRESVILMDSLLLNNYLNFKLSPILKMNTLKENVWLRGFNDVNNLFETCFVFNNEQLKDPFYQKELSKVLDNCTDILKTVFFRQHEDSQIQLGQHFQEIYDPELGLADLNFLSKLSIDSQLLLDVFLIVVKFLLNFESVFKMKMRYSNMGSSSLLQKFEYRSSTQNASSGSYFEVDEIIFKHYLKLFKIYLNLEYILKINYDYHDLDSDFSSLTISNIINRDRLHYSQQEKNLNSILKDDLEVLREKDLIVGELIDFKLPFRFLKIGSFIFNFVYDKTFKFVSFKSLGDVLFHLRVFLESRDDFV
ncbi:hypothetical protein OGAPHI_007026 [Ogataea philodendri]|uniref:C2H2-type domain-containing protein n=1 Tax=Ogataea philodendri TaxID=1378263 RepID=A0A9P8T025_9ASCO|nr:uncharacterized protein OGAPHI_007026 [Ogataea philodendri]KAH3660440.1 hypothetical protein OGAPHI_007026 [Ogataea philodendri]